MTDDEFWGIIALFDWDEAGDDDAVMEPAVAALASGSVERVKEFSEVLARMLHALDTREHARYGYLGEADPDNGADYISADGFLYLRCVVVANGRGFTEAVLADPTNMPRDLEFESLLYLAGQAYEELTGEDYDDDTEVSYESFSNAAGWAVTAETRAGVYTDESVPPGNRRPA